MPLDRNTTLLDALLGTSLDGIVVLSPVEDPEGGLQDLRFETVNRRAGEILGREVDELRGQLVLRDFFEGDETTFAKYRRVWQTGEPARFRVDRRSERLGLVFRGSIVRAQDRLVVTFADVTELVEANEALERQRVELLYQYELLDEQATELARIAESSDAARAEARNAERFVADLLEAIPVPVFFKRRDDGRLRMVNRRYAELHGRSTAEMEGRELGELLPSDVVTAIEDRDRQLYDGEEARQVYEIDIAFPAAGARRMVMHKAKMRDAENRMIGITGVMVDVTESHRLRQELERLATTDPLTGLANRRAFMSRLREELARTARHGRPLSVVMLDVDHFKSINDRHGHDMGDQVLQRVAAIVQASLRTERDLAARYGGEEFALLLPEADPAAARAVAERIRGTFEAAAVDVGSGPIAFTASFGVDSACPGREGDAEAMLKRADDALYRAKAAGRNRVHLAA